MSSLFLISAFGLLTTIPLHFIAAEHTKLEQKFGKKAGEKISKITGVLSSVPFLFWIGILIAPQPRFIFYSYLLHLLIAVPLLLISCWLGIAGVLAVGIKTTVVHSRPERIVTTGVYSMVRHPQHLAWVPAHIGGFFLFSGWHTLLFTPILVFLIYFTSKKEEKELIKEFGNEYRAYQKKTPMFIPRFP